MSKRFFTNEGDNTLLKKFAGVFASNPDIERFDAFVGYLRASGYFALRPHLEKVPLKEKALFIAAQHAVKLAKFQDWPRKLNAFQKAVNKRPVTTAAYLDKLLEIIRPYPLDVTESDSPAPESPAIDPKQLPQIILSESFENPAGS